MSIWERMVERVRHRTGGAVTKSSERGAAATSEGVESDRARRESMMSGEGFTSGAGRGEFPASRTGADEPLRGHEDER